MSDLDADLDAYLSGLDGETGPDEPPPPPEDVEGVDRLLYRIGYYPRQVADIRGRAAARVETVRAWESDRVSGLLRSIAFTERAVENWMRDRHAATGGKIKTEKVPAGELRIRPAKPSLYVLDDEKAAGSVAESRPHWVRTKLSISKVDAIREVFPGDVVTLDDNPAPVGYEWRAALALVDWVGDVFCVRPVLREAPAMVLQWPTQPTFGYSTKQEGPR